ncbi:MAG TPA: A/G-specific adenine glycosylase [Marinilabiliales bacterium]|nr:MAG: A/G-specific adenine glycosylase [Bacteroidetes bacterium GWA2_40_14]OFX61946.1 MAG: A/G-specific adenine glycosylase [Bacteroidetes bacterium GWC2_40_13]OFX74093.1 MAG: A/G-specific adenine glycosylase [Bacteroidetes bacterium GWD2_40_43]OFX93073.1 MAG: A/G-specific adenine glycosylase [Bacteroidetes bacterium GWE2_40_63]OFY21443.1 MAG: A/G-specific adenine glycosylase [Bacteroidetes bacterium GWF2_40_13]OFZ25135.1 MAG: A/G-specific adenine glycosylase [Bacteroidetes bacterium RIFOXYC
MNIGKTLIHWYEQYQRELPWRTTKNPYLIWVSEIIMQQTRIQQGLPYYLKFVTDFPTIEALASAPQDKVLLNWQGLGYYSRARNMHETAQIIVKNHNGIFPSSYHELLKLKGIGPYTAAAIASFCFNERIPAIDGNVNRVISRIYDIELPINKGPGQKMVRDFSIQTLGKNDPCTFNQAMMDFGALICTPTNPLCKNCPISLECKSLKNNTITLRPVKEKQAPPKARYFTYLVVNHKGSTLLMQRQHNDIWKGLYEFPMWEFDSPMVAEEFLQLPKIMKLLKGCRISSISENRLPIHKLSHQNIYSQFIQLTTEPLPKISNTLEVKADELKNYALPKLIINFLHHQKKEFSRI